MFFDTALPSAWIYYAGTALSQHWLVLVLFGFAALMMYGALQSWLCGRILKSLPHCRQCPPTALDPCMLLSAVKLSVAFEEGTLSPVRVAECYIAHIQRVNPFLNAVVFELFNEARAQAASAEKQWAAWRRSPSSVAKPHWLCGVPCTIKECIQVKGCPNSSGHHRRASILAKEDSHCVAKLRAAGCVFLGLTNVSELCMWMEANNKVYGITCNPYDTRRIVGGSSGGEGASVAACFAPFGLGSDVGGSIRMPAFFNGLYGYKASSHLIPNRGQHPGARGQIHHLLTTGPLCRFAEDLLPLAEVLAEGGFKEDAQEFPMPPKPFAGLHATERNSSSKSRTSRNLIRSDPQAVFPKRLRVFAIVDFGLFAVPVADAEKQAVLKAANHLRNNYGADVTVLNFRNPQENRPVPGAASVPPGWELFTQILPMWSAHMTLDKNERSFTDFMSEGLPEGTMLKPYHEFFNWLRGASPHTCMSIGLCMIEKTDELLLSDKYRRKNYDRGVEFRHAVQNELGDDAIIICPTYPIPAPKHHEPTWFPFQWQYTAAFNLIRTPTINLPMWSSVDASDAVAPAYEACRREGKPADHHVPKGVQVVAGWGNDRLPLAVASVLERDGIVGYKMPSWVQLPQK